MRMERPYVHGAPYAHGHMCMGFHTCMGVPYAYYGTSDLPYTHTCMGYPICVRDAPYAYRVKYTYGL